MENTWSLQAMMRPPKEQRYDDDGFGSIDVKKEYDQALLFCYPHLFDNNHDEHASTTRRNNHQVIGGHQAYLPVYGTDSEFSSPAAADQLGLQTIHRPADQLPYSADQEAVHDQLQQQQQVDDHINDFSSSNIISSQLIAPKLKKRKNQQKRVVVQVTADGLSSDPWAWRKYGQKPIKGSIYPRSYYRCSTSKGCLARRQVEQCCKDSSIYILTYTADHNHPQPTRRNSLAGINRNRFKSTPPPKSPASNSSSDDCGKTTIIPHLKDCSPSHHSPTTHSASSVDDEVALLQQSNIKQEMTGFYNKHEQEYYHHHQQGGHDHMMMMEGINNKDCMVFGDDFFEGLEDLGGYKMESSSYNFSNKQFPCLFS